MTKRKKKFTDHDDRYGNNEYLEELNGKLWEPTGEATNIESNENRSAISVCGSGVLKKRHGMNRS